jgi:carbon monoxide dehydrogenase subunit G
MIHMEGEKSLLQGREQVFAKLTDLQFLVNCLPDLHQVKDVKEKTAAAVLRPGFSFARGEMQLTIEKVEETPPLSARFLLKSKAIGSSSEVETTFSLSATDAGTVLHWKAEVKQLGGLLKAVPRGLIQGGAQRVIEELLGNVEKKLTP